IERVEILGDAAAYFDPKDPRAIADAMISMASDENLRKNLIAKGRTQAQRFDWNNLAIATKNVYDNALRK
ncbi:MAG: hypothetical protein AAB692_03715, partial [Patescibacteria group bacterium]